MIIYFYKTLSSEIEFNKVYIYEIYGRVCMRFATYFVGGENLDSFSSVQVLDPISDELLLLPERLFFISGWSSDPGNPNRSSVVRSLLLKRLRVLLLWSIDGSIYIYMCVCVCWKEVWMCECGWNDRKLLISGEMWFLRDWELDMSCGDGGVFI